LHGELKAAGWPAICIESRQAKAAMGATPNKTDRNDALLFCANCGKGASQSERNAFRIEKGIAFRTLQRTLPADQ
jgi:transposase